jgi:hypothetical protein
MHIDEDACRRSPARLHKKGLAVSKARGRKALGVQYDRKRGANRRVVVDNENFAHRGLNLHFSANDSPVQN